jgi:hypothetical protein
MVKLLICGKSYRMHSVHVELALQRARTAGGAVTKWAVTRTMQLLEWKKRSGLRGERTARPGRFAKQGLGIRSSLNDLFESGIVCRYRLKNLFALRPIDKIASLRVRVNL